MTLQRQRCVMYMLIVGAFVFSGLAFYMVAHWLAWNDPLYQRVFWSSFRPVAQLAGIIEQFGVWCPLAAGLLLGLCVVVVHAWR